MLISSDGVFFGQKAEVFILGSLCQKCRMNGSETKILTPSEGSGDSHTWLTCWEVVKTETTDALDTGTGGELIHLTKEEGPVEAAIKDEVVCTNAHKKPGLPQLFFFLVETSGKNMLRKENFCAAGSCCEEMKTWANYRMSAKKKGRLYILDPFFSLQGRRLI